MNAHVLGFGINRKCIELRLLKKLKGTTEFNHFQLIFYNLKKLILKKDTNLMNYYEFYVANNFF